MGELSRSTPRSLGSNALWNTLSTLWAAAVGFFLTPFLIGRIGSDHYGLYIFLLSVIGLMGVVQFGLGEATLHYVAGYYGRGDLPGINRVLGATLTVYGLAAVAISGAMYWGAAPLASLLSIPAQEHELGLRLLRITAVNFGVVSIVEVLDTIPKALLRYDVCTKVALTMSVTRTAGTVAVLTAGHGILAMMLWNTACSALAVLLNVAVSRRLLPGIRFLSGMTRAGLREVFHYGVFSTLSGVLYRVWSHADRLLLGTLVSASSVAYLMVPKNLAFRVTGAVQSAGSVLFPKFSTLTETEQRTSLYLSSTWILLTLTVVAFAPITALLPDFLRLWISAEFAARSAWVGQVVAFSCLIRGAFVPYEYLFRGLGRPQYVTLVYFCSGATSLLANIVLIPRYGLAGAGYCYLVTLAWGCAAIVLTWRRLLEQRSWRPLVRAVLLPALAGVLALAATLRVRGAVGEPDWGGLVGLAGGSAALTGLLVLGFERLSGGRESHVGELLQFIRSRLARRRGRSVA